MGKAWKLDEDQLLEDLVADLPDEDAHGARRDGDRKRG